MKKLLLITTTVFYLQQSNAQTDSLYLNQVPPDETPVLFAPGIVSIDGRYEYGIGISPEGKEIYYTASDPGDGLTVTRWDGTKWTTPVAANLRGSNTGDFEAFFTPDGNKLYFTSDTNNISNFWYMEKNASKWDGPIHLDSPVNNTSVMWCSFTSDETMYYGNNSNSKIHRAKLTDGKYTTTENLGFTGSHPSVAKDESFILFNSSYYGGFGKGDIFVVFRKEDGSWTKPVNIGNKINTSYLETCASLSPDGKYIFFSRYNEPGEKSNIYWAKVDELIDSLKQQAFTGIIEASKEQGFDVFPNPTTGIINIETNTSSEMTISDISGRELLKHNFNEAKTSMDLSGYPKGMYIVNKRTSKGIQTSKLIVE
jgi:Tol biopolymer transport system component